MQKKIIFKFTAVFLCLLLTLSAPASCLASITAGSSDVTVTVDNEEHSEYTVSFQSSGGSAVPSQTVALGNYARKPADPVKDGYSFKGWYKDSGCETLYDFDLPVIRNIILYAKWEAEILTYTVSFQSNGGTLINPQAVRKNAAALMPENPVKEGHIFMGWHKDSQCTKEYDFLLPVTSSFTLYAKWKKDIYTITFETNGGSSVSSQAVEYGQTVAKPQNPVKGTSIFKGWFTESSCLNEYDFNTQVKSSITLYAGWDASSGGSSGSGGSTGGSGNPGNSSGSGSGGSSGNSSSSGSGGNPGNNSSSGSSGNGSGGNTGSGGSPSSSPSPSGTIQSFVVTFNTMGGTSVSSQAVKKGDKAVMPKAPEKKGYGFTGWYKDDKCQKTYDFNSPVVSDLTLYAGWDKKDSPETTLYFTVRFNSNGGTSVASQDVKEGKKAQKPQNPFKEGYKFVGWYVDTKLKEKYDFKKGVNKSFTLYAGWQKVKEKKVYCTVSFITNGGTQLNPVKVLKGKKLKKPNKPIRTGYKFIGWYMDRELKKKYLFKSPVMESFNLYAEWEKIKDNEDVPKEKPLKYTITFNTNGGSHVNPQVVKSGGTLYNPGTPVKDGFKFSGWYLDPGLKSLYDFLSPVNSSFILYAKWDENDKPEDNGNDENGESGGNENGREDEYKEKEKDIGEENSNKNTQKGDKASNKDKESKPKDEEPFKEAKTLKEAESIYEEYYNSLSIPLRKLWDNAVSDEDKKILAEKYPDSFENTMKAWEVYQKFLKESSENENSTQMLYENFLTQLNGLSEEQESQWNNADLKGKYDLSENEPETYGELFKAWAKWQESLGNDISRPAEVKNPSEHTVTIIEDEAVQSPQEEDKTGKKSGLIPVIVIVAASLILAGAAFLVIVIKKKP